MSNTEELPPGNWQIMKGMAELAQAFPILEPVFQLHDLSDTFAGSCNQCISSNGSHDVPWPCPTIRTVLARGGVL